MMRKILFLCLVVIMAAGAIGSAAASLRIVPLVREGSVIVTVVLSDGYTDEIREAITSGLRTTFTYDVELRMAVPVWADRTIATKVVAISDRYDNLTRLHNLSRVVDGRVDSALVTEDEAQARRWLTSLTALAVAPTSKLDPNHEYYVRITANMRPPGSSLLGWANAITSQAKFTFIP